MLLHESLHDASLRHAAAGHKSRGASRAWGRLPAVTALPPAARDLLESGRLAHVVTLGLDGGPQVTCVWVGLDGDEIVSGHLQRYQKVRNVERNPRMALSLSSGRLNDFGLEEHLVVYGHARITEGGAPELLQRLAHVYLGPDVRFPPMADPPPGYILRITPDRIAGVGPWTTPATNR
jgi:PPOX class probable F420-dependent enzyme